jgi:hypothetical protein
MTANLKAPLVINTKEKIAKQVVLQENDQPIKHPMFKELRARLTSIREAIGSSARVAQKSVLHVSALPISTKVELI